MDKQIQVYKIASGLLHGIGKKKLELLLKKTNNIRSIFESSFSNLERDVGVPIKTIKKLNRGEALRLANLNYEFNVSHNIRSLFFKDESYPYQLKECKDAPIQLNLLGGISLENRKIVAIVGTRKCAPNSRHLVDELITQLHGHNIVVVSGLAFGIDTHVHQSCLDHKVETLAVLGHGLQMIYPRQNRLLAKNILKAGGGLLSEYHCKQTPNKYSFPQRNRIIAGLADVTIVIESPLKGGAMITAELANSYSREVMAIPNSIMNESLQGGNHLIKKNEAHMLTNAMDLFELMNWTKTPTSQKPCFLSNDEKLLMETIQKSSEIHIDDLYDKTGITLSKIQALLTQLELKNHIFSSPGMYYTAKA